MEKRKGCTSGLERGIVARTYPRVVSITTLLSVLASTVAALCLRQQFVTPVEEIIGGGHSNSRGMNMQHVACSLEILVTA